MAKVHSHYENLKVARDAPPEVIRAAYRSLSQKYHPDRNPGNSDASRIMVALNVAFETLSDPAKRQEHDQWIAASEANQSADQASQGNSNSPPRDRAFTVDEEKFRQASKTRQSPSYQTAKDFARTLRSPNLSLFRKAGLFLAHLFRNWLWYGIGAFAILGVLNDKPKAPPPGPKPYVAASVSAPASTPAYVRPAAAPNGRPWPMSSAYITGYQHLHNNGLSSVTIDNSQNDSEVFVKLVSLDGPQAYPVRTFLVSARGSFTLGQVTAGNYDIRYRDLDTGGLSRSEAFSLEETPTDKGTQFSNMTMTLYKVRDGNMQTYGLAESEF